LIFLPPRRVSPPRRQERQGIQNQKPDTKSEPANELIKFIRVSFFLGGLGVPVERVLKGILAVNF
jgi:hypothetical protein